MKKFYYLAIVALVAIVLNSCGLLGGGGNNDPQYKQSDLYGLWEENKTQHYVRFTEEKSDEEGFLYGREWDEAEDVMEEDLLPYGNGWFKYELKTSGTLTEIHLMDNGGAEIPKVYVVSKLTSSELSYYEKDRTSNKFNFTKVVEAK